MKHFLQALREKSVRRVPPEELRRCWLTTHPEQIQHPERDIEKCFFIKRRSVSPVPKLFPSWGKEKGTNVAKLIEHTNRKLFSTRFLPQAEKHVTIISLSSERQKAQRKRSHLLGMRVALP